MNSIIGIAVGVAILGGVVAYGISTFASKAVESMARQPEAADSIEGSIKLPMMLMEGVFVIGILLFGGLVGLIWMTGGAAA